MALFFTTDPLAFYDDAIAAPPTGAKSITVAARNALLVAQSQGKVLKVSGSKIVASDPPVVQAPPVTRLAPLEFFARFTSDEEAAIASAAMSNAQIFLWFTKASAARYIDITDQVTIAGVNALVQAQLITLERSMEILATS